MHIIQKVQTGAFQQTVLSLNSFALSIERLVLLNSSGLETAEISHGGLLSTSRQLLSPSSLVPLILNRGYK